MLPEALRLTRLLHDAKQTDLADRLGISKFHLSEVERGRSCSGSNSSSAIGVQNSMTISCFPNVEQPTIQFVCDG